MLHAARARPLAAVSRLFHWDRRGWTLSTQFLLANLAITSAGMLLIGFLVGRQVEDGVLNRTAALTALYVDSVVAPRLQGLASRSRLDDGEVKTLNWLLTSTPLASRVVTFKVWSLDGQVLYSPDPRLIGQTFPVDANLARATRGGVSVDMSDLDEPENVDERARWSHLVEVYVPVRDLTRQRVIAVTEFYQLPDELDAAITAARTRTWAVVAGGLLVMYLLLAGIVRRGSDTIVRQQATLREQVAELSRLLDQNQRLHERVRHAASRTTTLNEQAFRRIGADLHDGPAQALALALLRLDAPALWNGDVNKRNAELTIVQKAVQDALGEVRAIASGLRLPELASLTVVEAVERTVQGHERRSGVAVALDLERVPEWAPLAVKIALVRSLQEALSNAVRHGGGIDVRAHVWADNAALFLTVRDAGPGFDPAHADAAEHLGLAGMRERAELLGGGFAIDAAPGRGAVLAMHWPLQDGDDA